MTLDDLYNSLKWPDSNDVLEKWAKQYNRDYHPDIAWEYSWRLVIVLFSLPKNMVWDTLPPDLQVDWTPEKQDDARRILGAAGVWPQIVDFLTKHDLFNPTEPTRSIPEPEKAENDEQSDDDQLQLTL